MQNKSSIDLSIILVNWNAKKLLKQCIESIINETKKVSYEIILVDNNSTDGSAQMVEENFKSVVLIKNSENRGFAAANNQAMKIAKGDYILLLNSDTVVLNDALDKCYERILGEDKIGLIGCKLLNSDMSLQPSCYNFNSLLNAIMFKTKAIKFINKKNRYKYEGLMQSFDYNTEMDVDYVCGAFMLYKRDILEKVGFLDESFFMYAEETDYCARIKEAGYRILFYPGAEIIHYGGGSSKKISAISENRRIVSRLKFIKKHRGTMYYHLYRFLSTGNVLLNILRSDTEMKKNYKSKLKAIRTMKYE